MSSRKKNGSFTETLEGFLRQQGSVCSICEHPERAEIEEAVQRGVPRTIVASTLQKIEAIDPKLTPDTAVRRLTAHMTNHPSPEDGEKT